MTEKATSGNISRISLSVLADVAVVCVVNVDIVVSVLLQQGKNH